MIRNIFETLISMSRLCMLYYALPLALGTVVIALRSMNCLQVTSYREAQARPRIAGTEAAASLLGSHSVYRSTSHLYTEIYTRAGSAVPSDSRVSSSTSEYH